jgi:dihydrolipoamide dehydrogenase
MNQTNVPNIFAIGDVSGAPWLAHRASSQAHVAVGHMLGKSVRKLENLLIPGCTYCEPQVASLGLTEENAIKEGYQIKVGRSFFKSSGKALALGNTEGFIKLIFDEQYGELIGAHIIGSEATELIGELVMAKNLEATIEDLAYTIHAHPTLSESIMEAALDALGIPVHH